MPCVRKRVFTIYRVGTWWVGREHLNHVCGGLRLQSTTSRYSDKMWAYVHVITIWCRVTYCSLILTLARYTRGRFEGWGGGLWATDVWREEDWISGLKLAFFVEAALFSQSSAQQIQIRAASTKSVWSVLSAVHKLEYPAWHSPSLSGANGLTACHHLRTRWNGCPRWVEGVDGAWLAIGCAGDGHRCPGLMGRAEPNIWVVESVLVGRIDAANREQHQITASIATCIWNGRHTHLHWAQLVSTVEALLHDACLRVNQSNGRCKS